VPGEDQDAVLDDFLTRAAASSFDSSFAGSYLMIYNRNEHELKSSFYREVIKAEN
jgi:hypothetical protein